jgi:hypothetical protein
MPMRGVRFGLIRDEFEGRLRRAHHSARRQRGGFIRPVISAGVMRTTATDVRRVTSRADAVR